MSVYCVRKFFDWFRRGRVQSNGQQSETLKRWWDLLLCTGRAEGFRTRILEPDHKTPVTSMFFEPATDGVINKRTNIWPFAKVPARFHPDSNRKPAAWRLRLIAWRLRIETAISVVRFPPPPTTPARQTPNTFCTWLFWDCYFTFESRRPVRGRRFCLRSDRLTFLTIYRKLYEKFSSTTVWHPR